MPSNKKPISRRNLLKNIGATGAIVAVPGVVNAKCFHSSYSSAMADAAPVHRGLTIEFADAGASNVDAELVRVAVSNMTGKTIELSQLSPGVINVDGKTYDLNSQLAAGPVSIDANKVRYFWLSPSRQDGYPSRQKHATGHQVAVNVLRGLSRVTETQQAYFS